jgi:hypothetical protein
MRYPDLGELLGEVGQFYYLSQPAFQLRGFNLITIGFFLPQLCYDTPHIPHNEILRL